MRYTTLFLSPLALLGATLFPEIAQAREFSQWHQTLDVSGQLRLPSGERQVRQLRVELDTDGRAFVRFDAERNDRDRNDRDNDNWNFQSPNRQSWSNGQTAFSGVWYGNDDRVTVDLREGLGRQIVFGKLLFVLKPNWNGNRPEVRSIVLDGSLLRRPWDTPDFSGRFSLDENNSDDGNWNDGNWNGGGNWTNRPQAITELSSVKSGSGTLVLDGKRQNLRRARVELSRDGRAQLQLEGDQTYSYEGRWRQTQAREIALKLDGSAAGVFGAPGQNRRRDDESLGRGEITISGASFQKLNLQGRLGDRDFKASFEVGQRRDDDKSVVERWRENFNNKDSKNDRDDDDDDAPNWNGGKNSNWDASQPNLKPNSNVVESDETVDASGRGQGTLTRGREKNEISNVSVKISRDGRAQVTLSGGQNFNLSGTSKRTARDCYDLALSGDNGASGNAQIRVKGSNLVAFVFRGRMGATSATLRFIP